jgi:hypothetical protein
VSDFDDAIGDMVSDLLNEAGGSFTYFRGSTGTAVTLRKSNRMPVVIDAGNGTMIEVHAVDFIGLSAEMPYAVPLRGDRIVGGGETFEVQPSTGDKVYLKTSPKMIRIHTKQVG